MTYTTLISADQLARHIEHSEYAVFDCRFSLADSALGAKAYRHGHLPGARYAHLNQDLSSPTRCDIGRHPLPNFKQLAAKLSDWGISNDSQVVVYDDAGGAFAGRMWWLLRSMGHRHVAVLDGGIQQWQRQGYALTTHLPKTTAGYFEMDLDDSQWLSAQQVENALACGAITLIDARTPERFSGVQEPIDPVAGHIPKAKNRPLQTNLTANGLFRSAHELKAEFDALLGSHQPQQVVHYCGSGVTACHNLLAMEVAGLIGSKLYAGSWSEWISNPNRRVAKGC